MATVIQKLGLLRGLLNTRKAYAGPFFVDIDVTERCNLRCLGCPRNSAPGVSGRPNRDFPLPEFRSLCSELRMMGTRSLFLQGPGEPLLHPLLDEMIGAAKAEGFQVTLATNGTLLDRAMIRHFIEMRLNVLRVSLWAATAGEYGDNYPGVDPSNLDRVIENLRLAAQLKRENGGSIPKLLLHQPVNRLNCRGLEHVLELASDTGCDGVSFTPMHDHPGAAAPFVLTPGQARKAHFALRRLRAKATALGLTDNFEEILLRFDLGLWASGKRPCYAGWLHAHVRVDGAVHPCGHYPATMGNAWDTKFGKIWNSSEYGSFRRRALCTPGTFRAGRESECGYCCLAEQNAVMHGYFRWFLPLVRLVCS